MLSSIKVDYADLGEGFRREPVIMVHLVPSDDVRDKLLKELFEKECNMLHVNFVHQESKANKHRESELRSTIMLSRSIETVALPEFPSGIDPDVGKMTERIDNSREDAPRGKPMELSDALWSGATDKYGQRIFQAPDGEWLYKNFKPVKEEDVFYKGTGPDIKQSC